MVSDICDNFVSSHLFNSFIFVLIFVIMELSDWFCIMCFEIVISYSFEKKK